MQHFLSVVVQKIGYVLQFDITFHKLPCAWTSLDAMDISGEMHLDVVSCVHAVLFQNPFSSLSTKCALHIKLLHMPSKLLPCAANLSNATGS